MAVVKSEAYGHGMREVARALDGEVAGFAVFAPDEGVSLRAAGIRAPILVMGPSDPGGFRSLARLRISPTVSGWADLAAASRGPGGTLDAHVKFDTGMGRLGFPWFLMREVAGALAKKGVHRMAGVFTHLSTASDRAFTSSQVRRFESCLNALRGAGIRADLVHVASSPGILSFPRASALWGARPGLLLYGCTPGPHVPFPLRPAMAFKTRIARLREVPAGTPVSYGHTHVTRRRTTLAVLPVGYARGLSRHLSNRGEVLVRGRRLPIVGRVCMDMTVVDAGPRCACREGDEVVIIGRQGRREIRAEEVAEIQGTIPYEVLCAAGAMNPRFRRAGGGRF